MTKCLGRYIMITAFIAMLLGCITDARYEKAAKSVSEIYSKPFLYRGQNLCVVGFLHFDRANPLISDQAFNGVIAEKAIIPISFDRSNFYDRNLGEYKSNLVVIACGIIYFDKECFSSDGDSLCIPGRILLKRSTVKIVN